jgi:CRISPR-associated endoribonuclease Cas6
MRLRVQLDNPHGTVVPINHQEYLTAAVYALLKSSDEDYARFLHDEGYAGDDGRAFKLFTFSGLRAPRRIAEGDRLRLPPGPVEWLVSSPLEPFLTNLATGLLGVGHLQVAAARFPIREIQTLPPPDLAETTRFTCLMPIVSALPLPDGGTRYLRPAEGAEFSEAVRNNLLRKHRRLHGHPPADDRFTLTFDPAYLARDRNGGTKLIAYKGIQIRGALCPFTVTGSPALMQTMLDCGAGEKNAAGFGMVDVKP